MKTAIQMSLATAGVLALVCGSSAGTKKLDSTSGKNAGTAYSMEAPADAELSTNPGDAFWQGAQPIVAERDPWGKTVKGYRTTIYSRWTEKNLYFLFVCPYQDLRLKEDPQTATETNELWKWDVAEVFIGWNFDDIKQYKEFEMSPQGEWVDLDIDLEHPHEGGGWKWNSGFQVAARIDRGQKIWYGAMKIPMTAIANGPVQGGTRFRINFYRSQWAADGGKKIMWQAVMNESFHTPDKFGILELVAPSTVTTK
ncbi:MAG TPA: carbohydrate-binding family 9-like protein [Candidatus Acidoferrum sp.]|nr:carbohydrate-binding family 9-like protein [Candidatus Acidoferrum sp.]